MIGVASYELLHGKGIIKEVVDNPPTSVTS